MSLLSKLTVEPHRVAGLLGLWCFVCFVAVGVGGPVAYAGQQSGVVPLEDRMDLPPLQRQVHSVSSGFVLTLKTLDGWKTPRAVASLTNASGSVLWQRELPHRHGPRRALVTNTGQVLLLDEWINSVSPYALTLIAPSGVTIAEYSTEAIITLLAVPRSAVSGNARYGIWITEGPTLSPDAKSVLFKAGGRSLFLNLSDGRLSARD